MLPTLREGDQVLVALGAPVAPGMVVLVRHPEELDLILVKRVDHITDTGQVHVLGDNPEASTDTRHFGTVSAISVLGRVTARLGRA